jgi:hypothetical protein
MPPRRGLSDAAVPFIPFQTKQLQDVLAHPEIRALVTHPDDERRLRDCVAGLSSEGAVDTETLVQATKRRSRESFGSS